MNKNRLIILIVTTIAVVTWVASQVIFAKPSTPVPANLQSALEPVSPDFDQETLAKIAKTIKPLLVQQVQVIRSSPSPTPSIKPATPSAKPTASNAALPGGGQ
ncbi:hypothetical protein A2631_04660 [Candidatus Daviesbacteria bacterium RIFCSPHIGHO2_01_FULL_44_29]|uniref:Uncharacterized protein n=1 Tax=Candidatus Daviesbacteria bacterium RIFCSPHIGHO2_02_FULL_43_12 TaxID=1797776 RepID=A0A1F5KGE7_9BACT|nr:MAG: hypothetical protein A2631_04660 [Candidatus Daviesbacteria bacterium RIFCSPHIGHO2_01_FULL_44_29]OGE40012.1 MAG: hypothetical protein A3D25_04390 [Candidatus Daviesbacteria bacterium RIFCSPHIGHO2_02_FULL_43_12]OGE41504.1 MAG: hypothetical protein A3E86_05420 [Candidatus Daviesbacteria bacterium RIFCSPHIGHO2_12_FULL_47_45]OGE70307.1 MAG: hypothetical protein A3B55_01180 [Candidatus Daviesbacteria bacterium RIFCSPLOWO2_01_FULL_43_15]